MFWSCKIGGLRTCKICVGVFGVVSLEEDSAFKQQNFCFTTCSQDSEVEGFKPGWFFLRGGGGGGRRLSNKKKMVGTIFLALLADEQRSATLNMRSA